MTLQELRQNIDATDVQLLQLLSERARLAQQVGHIKQQEGSVVFRPERELQVIDSLQTRNTRQAGLLKNSSVAHIWREIMSACRAIELQQRVAYLGPQGTFSEMASVQFFGASMAHVPCVNFDAVFACVASGQADFGVVPIENNTEGSVGRTLDLFLDTPVHIVGETSLLVRHCLLAQNPPAQTKVQQDDFGHIDVVLAHPQALAQCQNWLNVHIPHAERRAVSSNAQGASEAKNQPRWAAIGGEKAGAIFGLHILAHGIQDELFNRTRFAVVALPQTQPAPPASHNGKDGISLVLSVPNRAGAIADVLLPLKTHGVSMSRFESRPAKSGANTNRAHSADWAYFFYIDLVGHPTQKNVAAALAEIEQLCTFYKLLGTYAIGH